MQPGIKSQVCTGGPALKRCVNVGGCGVGAGGVQGAWNRELGTNFLPLLPLNTSQSVTELKEETEKQQEFQFVMKRQGL